VPRYAYDETADQLADRWVREWGNGIEDSGVKPGFMKIGVDEIESDSARLSSIDEKIVRASARASRRTGLAVTCHTGGGPAGLAAAKVFIGEKADPGRFVVAHSDGHGLPINQAVAELGAWVSFDAISRRPLELHLKLVRAMTQRHAGSLLLSHDNGWYCRKRLVDAVVVYRYDRFARSLRSLVNALEEFRSLDMDFISIHEGVDTSTPNGRLIFGIFASIAEFERELIRDRVRSGLAAAKAKGKRIGRPRVAVDASRIDALRRQGRSWAEITQETGISKGTAQRAVAGLPTNPLKGDFVRC